MFLELAQSIQSMETEIRWLPDSHSKDSKSSHQGGHRNEKKTSVKYVASTTNRFKVRDLEDFKDEKTHRVEGRTEVQHHTFYYSILKLAMKRTQQKPLWRGWP